MTFKEWISSIEDEGTQVEGLRHCAIEYRKALQEAYEAGRDTADGDPENCVDYLRRHS